jgi:hypothetical protein
MVASFLSVFALSTVVLFVKVKVKGKTVRLFRRAPESRGGGADNEEEDDTFPICGRGNKKQRVTENKYNF